MSGSCHKGVRASVACPGKGLGSSSGGCEGWALLCETKGKEGREWVGRVGDGEPKRTNL